MNVPRRPPQRVSDRVAEQLQALVRERRLRFGPNGLPQTKPRSPLLRFLAQFNNLLIQVLLVAAAISSMRRASRSRSICRTMRCANGVARVASPAVTSTSSAHGRPSSFSGERASTRTCHPASSSAGTKREPM